MSGASFVDLALLLQLANFFLGLCSAEFGIGKYLDILFLWGALLLTLFYH